MPCTGGACVAQQRPRRCGSRPVRTRASSAHGVSDNTAIRDKNVTVAAALASLFLWMARRSGLPEPRERALYGACLFAATPMACEAVAYVASRSSVLVALFTLLSLRLAVPVHTGIVWLDWPVFLAAVLGVAVLVGVVESTMARLRLTHVPLLLVAACLLSGFVIILVVR